VAVGNDRSTREKRAGRPVTEAYGSSVGRELATRHARRDGRTIVVLRALAVGEGSIVEAEVYPGRAGTPPTHAGPYRFGTAAEATTFLAAAVEALTYLGCEIE